MFEDLSKKLKSLSGFHSNCNNTAALLVGLAVITMAPAEMMASESKHTVYGRVVSSQELFRDTTVTIQREVCDEIRRKVSSSTGSADGGASETVATIIGGALGGVLGHQVGGGSGKTAATIGGTILGSFAGKNLAQNNGKDIRKGDTYEIGQECRIVEDEKEVRISDGFMVEAVLPNGDHVEGHIDKMQKNIPVEVTTSYRIK